MFCIFLFLTALLLGSWGGLLEPISATYGKRWAFGCSILCSRVPQRCSESVLGCPPTTRTPMFCLHPGLNQDPPLLSPVSYLFVSFYVIGIFLELRSTVQHWLLELKDSSLVFSMTDHAVLSVPGKHEWWKTKKKRGGGREKEEGNYVIV